MMGTSTTRSERGLTFATVLDSKEVVAVAKGCAHLQRHVIICVGRRWECSHAIALGLATNIEEISYNRLSSQGWRACRC